MDGDPYEEGFWHLVTKWDYRLSQRLLDPRRAERLPWCKPTVENCSDPEARMWDYQEGSGKVRTYIWLENYDYVVILERRLLRTGRRVAFLITTFYVSGSQTRSNLMRKYQRRM